MRYCDQAELDLIADVAWHNGHFGNQADRQRIRDELNDMSDLDIHYLCAEYGKLQHLILGPDVLYDSPKMLALQELLPRLMKDGHRILIFSQWTRLLDLLELLMHDLQLPFLRLDGSTAVKERQLLIDQFSAPSAGDPLSPDYLPVFLLSTKAGGLGINLTASDTVIMHDLDFNPENDRQAEDRCHRIGQTRPVTVFKLLTEDSVDEAIYNIGQRKSAITKAVLRDGRAGAGAGDEDGGIGVGSGADEEEAYDFGSILREALSKRSTSGGN